MSKKSTGCLEFRNGVVVCRDSRRTRAPLQQWRQLMSWLWSVAHPARVNRPALTPTAKGPKPPQARTRRIVIAVLLLVAVAIASPQIWFWWQLSSARQALSSARPTVAVEFLRRALWFAPNNAETHYLLAVAERRAGHLDRVAPLLDRALELGWSKDEVERQSLLTIAQDGNIDAIDARLKAIMTQGVRDDAAEEIYEALAIGYLKTYRLKDAWQCLNSWSEWQPRAVFPKFWRADICRRIDNRTGEEAEYRAILEIDPRHSESRRRLAEVLKDSNRIDEAKGEYERCLTEGVTTPDVLIGLAECHRRLAQGATAVPILNRALTLSPTVAERAAILSELGQIAADEGRSKEAVDKLEEAARLDPSQASIRYSLSQAYAQSGDQVRSSELFEQSKQIRARQDRVGEITRQLLKTPNDADLRYEAGKIMMDLGLKNEGADWLRTVLKIQPGHQLAREALAAHDGAAQPESRGSR